MIKIDQEFKSLIPPLSVEEFEQLEKNCIAEGIRESILLWNDTIIDGHNRYEIATKHNIAYKTALKEFDSRDKATEWMIMNQFGRRNLSTYQRSLLALKLKPVFEEKAKENKVESGKLFGENHKKEEVSQKSDKPLLNVNTNKELAKVAGVSHDTIAKVQKIEEKAPEKVKEQIQSGAISINKAYSDIRREEKRVEIKIAPPKQLDGCYDVIYADPPWNYNFAETESRAIENHYPTMDLEDIKNIKVPSAENSALFLWVTAPKLEEGLQVLNAWGFTYKTCAVWDKEIIGMGYWFRGQHEILLVGIKGNFKTPAPEHRESSVYKEKRTQHSKKPTHYYEWIEKAFPNQRYLEMFSRNKHNDKWEVWGNQSE